MNAASGKDNAAFLVVVLSFLVLLILAILVFGQGPFFPAQVYLRG